MLYSFDQFSVDVGGRELRRGNVMIEIEPQVFDVLVYLIEHRDRVVSKEELLEAIWEGRAVSESALTSRINAARSTVGDTGASQKWIRTSARKGYRFVGLLDARDDARVAPKTKLRQEVRFCTAADGPHIASRRLAAALPSSRPGIG